MHFPNISKTTILPIQAVLTMIKDDPTVLDRENCPYDNDVKAFFKKLTDSYPVSVPSDTIFDGSRSKLEVVEEELSALLADLKNTSRKIPDGESEKIQLMRLSSQVIEKLVSLLEKTYNMREMSEFQRIVIEFLEEDCEPEQVNKLKERLADLKSMEQ